MLHTRLSRAFRSVFRFVSDNIPDNFASFVPTLHFFIKKQKALHVQITSQIIFVSFVPGLTRTLSVEHMPRETTKCKLTISDRQKYTNGRKPSKEKSQITFMPARARARRADCAPGPGVLVLFPPVARILMCSAVIPSS